jgi:hypothetical protein
MGVGREEQAAREAREREAQAAREAREREAQAAQGDTADDQIRNEASDAMRNSLQANHTFPHPMTMGANKPRYRRSAHALPPYMLPQEPKKNATPATQIL